MKIRTNIAKDLRRWVSQINAVACICLLLFLTVSNYYIYSEKELKIQSIVLDEDATPQTDDGTNKNPVGPDEKTPNSASITEEYCHESTDYEFDITIDHKHNWFYLLKKDKLLSYPTITPPPDRL